jgi:ABC-type multidrug transport system ATPase subunit
MDSTLVLMQGVSKRYQGAGLLGRVLTLGRDRRAPTTALRDVSFELAPRDIMAVLGGVGSGKSTLLRCVAGLMTPTAGSVRVLGQDPAGITTTVRGRIGWIPAWDTSFHPRLTGEENLLFFAELHGIAPGVRHRQVRDLMGAVGLPQSLDRAVRAYAPGSRLRLSMARALLCDPALVIMDEVTTGLDPRRRDAFYTLTTALVTARGAGILLSTRDLTEAQYFCTRVMLLDEGRVAAEGAYMDVESQAEAVFRRYGTEDLG